MNVVEKMFKHMVMFLPVKTKLLMIEKQNPEVSDTRDDE